MNSLILPSVTTFIWNGRGGWRDKVREIDELGLKEVAVFVTAALFKERQELYRALEAVNYEIPPNDNF